MNAWQITLTALATIAGLCAFGFGLVAMIQATNAAEAVAPRTAVRTLGSKVLTILIWAAYLFIFLFDRQTSGILAQISTSIIVVFGAAFWTYALIQIWRVRTARNWAYLATSFAVVASSCVYFLF